NPPGLRTQVLSGIAVVTPSNKAGSMFEGGSGGSAASLEGLRNVLRNRTERDSAPVGTLHLTTTNAVVPGDDECTLRGLNERLSGYLGRVKQLEKDNRQLTEEIEEISVNRKTLEHRDWQQLEKPLKCLKNQIKDLAMNNAKLLLQIANTKLANADFLNKFSDEMKARKVIEEDLFELKKDIEDTQLRNEQKQKEIDLVKDELADFEQDHKNAVDDLREKIGNFEVCVEIETPNSNFLEIVNNIRRHYDKLATKNMKETEDCYQTKFENIKLEEAQNTEALQSGKTELRGLLKQKQDLEIKISAGHSTIRNLEENLRFAKLENSQRLGPLKRTILDLEQQLRKVRAHVQNQLEMNKDVLCARMRLEAEIIEYQKLIVGDVDSLDFSSDDALPHDQQKSDGEVSEEQESATEVVTTENKSAKALTKSVEER
ncbi:keratin, type I cytoskeletal 18-like, partial [Syngnathoides biaculeatus]|uniref:keratin, type I cytoskeletal 18-like n=1 Tax=Syngnathoides biaculeatus TaxID=300417 RepID=UPI002ADDA342